MVGFPMSGPKAAGKRAAHGRRRHFQIKHHEKCACGDSDWGYSGVEDTRRAIHGLSLRGFLGVLAMGMVGSVFARVYWLFWLRCAMHSEHE